MLFEQLQDKYRLNRIILYSSPDKKICLHDKKTFGKIGKEKPNHVSKDPISLLSTTSCLFQACSPKPPSINSLEHCMDMKVHFHKSSSTLREDDSLPLSLELRHIALKSLRRSWV